MRASRLTRYVTPLAHTSCAGSIGARRGPLASPSTERPSRELPPAERPSSLSSVNSGGRYLPSSAHRAPSSTRCLERYIYLLLLLRATLQITIMYPLRGALPPARQEHD